MKSASRKSAAHRPGQIIALDLFKASPTERINTIKRGVHAALAVQVSDDLGIPKTRFSEILGLPLSTVNRKVQKRGLLSTEHGERLLGMVKLIGQVTSMTLGAEKGTGFDAEKWLAHWLDEPSAVLNGKRPADFMDTAEGQELVSDLLARMESGAYG
jgi:putative toxin-antitoxin system antitoxin component (TIGR02293 family)